MPNVLVQVDVRTPLEAVEAVLAGARFLVCDRMHPDVLAGAVRQIRAATREPVEIAVSGIDDLSMAKDYAQTGVDHIYVESLTQHSTALDVGMVIA